MGVRPGQVRGVPECRGLAKAWGQTWVHAVTPPFPGWLVASLHPIFPGVQRSAWHI